jgi:hypothetical protein
MIPCGSHKWRVVFIFLFRTIRGVGRGRQRKYRKEKAIREFPHQKKFPASVLCGKCACLRATPFLGVQHYGQELALLHNSI